MGIYFDFSMAMTTALSTSQKLQLSSIEKVAGGLDETIPAKISSALVAILQVYEYQHTEFCSYLTQCL